jgi:alkylhydroperoxidase/carboxymuconolactone decarboxylase family protein YurZ
MTEETDIEELPSPLQRFISGYPDIWEAYEDLGERCTGAGPLPEKYIHLIKLGIHGVSHNETPFKSHVSFALEAGATFEEIEHTIIQLLTAQGIGPVVKLIRWAREAAEKD